MSRYAIVDGEGQFRGIFSATSEVGALNEMNRVARGREGDYDDYDDDSPFEVKRVISVRLSEVCEYHVRVYCIEEGRSFYSDEASDASLSENPIVWMPV